MPELIPHDDTVGTGSSALKPLVCCAPEAIVLGEVAGTGVPLAVEAGSEVSVSAFTSPDDRDPDLVLAAPGRGGQIDASPAVCWLVVRHLAVPRCEGGDGTTVAAPRGAPAPVVFSDYRRHERSDGAARSVVDDLRHPRFAHRIDDVRSLRSGEALALEAAWRLATLLEVGWADVLAGGAGALAGIVGAAAPLCVALPAAATVRGKILAAGRFALVFARLPNGRVRIAVKSGGGCVAGAPGRPTADLADPADLEPALHDVAASLLGCAHVTIRAVAGKASPAELTEEELLAAETLATRLGFGALERGLPELQRELRRLDGALAEALAELAAGKLADGFAYEEARLPRGAAVLQASLDAEALERFHAPLCRGDLAPLVAAIADADPGVALESYLGRRAVERSRCWGFTLGVAPWAASGRGRRTLTRVVRRGPAGYRQESGLGLGAYEGRWLADVADWTVDLRADLPGAPRAEAAPLAEFEIGLHLAWHWRYLRFEADELDAALDMAVLWGVVAQEDAAAVRATLARALGRAAEVTVQLRLDDAPLRSLLGEVAKAADADFAAALGAAMAWRKGSPGRGDPARRSELYGPLWGRVLDQPDVAARTLVALARTRLADSADPQLAFLEENYLRLTPTSTFVGLARVANQGTAAAWTAFRSAAALLHEALGRGARDDETFERAFAPMAGVWALPHHVRALGALLVGLGSRSGVGGAVARTLTVTAGDAGSETALIVAAPSA